MIVTGIKEFKIGKGTSYPLGQSGNDTWIKKYLELTITLPEQYTEEGFHASVARAEQIIDEWLKGAELPSQVFLMEDIEKLNWHASNWVRKDDPDRKARSGEDAWIKRGDCARLEGLLQSSNGKVELPPYEFKFAGYEKGGDPKKGTLIVRNAMKATKQ